MYLHRKLKKIRPVIVLLIWVLLFGMIGEPLAIYASTQKDTFLMEYNEEQQSMPIEIIPEEHVLTIGEIVTRFETDPSFVRQQIDAGLSFNEIYNIFYQAEERGISFIEAREYIYPIEINNSSTVSSSVYSDPNLTPLLKDVNISLTTVTRDVYMKDKRETVTENVYVEIPSEEEARSTVTRNVYNQETVTKNVYEREDEVETGFEDLFASRSTMLLAAGGPPAQEKPPVYQASSFNEAPYNIGNNGESISSLSGSLSVQSTDLTLPGRGGLSFSLTRQYHSNDAQLYEPGYDYRTYDSSYNIWWVPFDVTGKRVVPKYKLYIWENKRLEYDNNSDGSVSYASPPQLVKQLIGTFNTEEEARRRAEIYPWTLYTVPEDRIYATTSFIYSNLNLIPYSIPILRNQYSGDIGRIGEAIPKGNPPSTLFKDATDFCSRSISGIYNRGIWTETNSTPACPSYKYFSDTEGYSGNLPRIRTDEGKQCPSPNSPNVNGVCTKGFTAIYSGKISKTTPDTRSYQQFFGGMITRPAYQSTDRYESWQSQPSGTGRVRTVYSRVGAPWFETVTEEEDLAGRLRIESGPYSSEAAAISNRDLLNNSVGAYIDTININGDFVKLYVAPSPGATVEVANIPATGVEYYNTTSKPLKEKLYPIGKGWSWKLPFIETKDGKTIVHLAEGGSYQVEGTKLKDFEWEGPLFRNDTTITVNDEKSKSVLISTDGTQLQYFSEDGRLLRISDLYDNTIDFYYETNSIYGTKLLSKVQDAIGNVIQISYNKDQVTLTLGDRIVRYHKSLKEGIELLDSVVDPIGRKTTYDYQIKNAKFNLLSSYPERASSNPYALLTRIQHPTGAASEYNYENNPVKRYIGSDSFNEAYRISTRQETVTYTTSDKRTYNQQQYFYNNSDMASSYGTDTNFTVTVNDGLTSSLYQYGKKHINDRTTPQYYLQSIMKSADQVERSITYKYEKFVASRSYPALTPTSVSVSTNQTSDVLETRMSFDNYGNILTEIDTKGNRTERTYDKERHLLSSELKPTQEGVKTLTEYERNAKGTITQMKTMEQPSGKLLGQVNWTTFDRYGNALERQILNDDRVITSIAEYDGQYDYAFVTTQKVQVGDVEGLRKDIILRSSYNALTGEMSSSTDGEGHTTRYYYDRLGRVVKVQHPDQTFIEAVYDDLNNTVTVTDEVGIRTQTRWNALGWEVENGWFDGARYVKKKAIGYDSFGRVEWEQDARGNLTQHRYDLWSRLIQTQYPDGSHSTTSFDEPIRMTKRVDGEGYAISQYYDKWGRVQRTEEQTTSLAFPSILQTFSYDSVSDFILATADGKGQATEYRYNSLGDLIQVTNAEGEITRYTYDMVGNRINTIFADGAVKSKTYNELKLLISEEDEVGRNKTYAYDNNGNLVRHTDRNGVTFTMQYDSRNRQVIRHSPDETVSYTYDGTGKRLSMADNTGTTAYQYEPNSGRLMEVQYPDGLSLSIPEYDPEGNRMGLVDPFGVEVGFSFDVMNRLSRVSSKVGDTLANYSYTRNGLLKQKTGISNIVTLREYAGVDLTGVRHAKLENTLNRYEYSYDVNKNIERRIQNNEEDSYGYDSLDRIANATGTDNESYEYDQRGNRLTLESSRPFSLEEMDYTYDTQNRLVQVRTGTKTVQYGYNGDGLLVSRTEDGETRRYYYDGNQMIAEARVVGGAPQLIASYIRGNQLEAIRYADGSQAYPLYNGHGDLVELRSEDGTILNKYSYDMWGNIIEMEETVYNPFRYSGEYWDESTGLQYLRARWYDPSIGRFINQDTYEGEINNPLSQNLYTYVYNNPLIYMDPSGFSPVGPGNGSIFDSNQWSYLSNLANNGNGGQREWANKQIKQQLYYKKLDEGKKGSTIAIPAPATGTNVAGGASTIALRVAGVIGIIATISGSESDISKEKRFTVYRALTSEDAASLAAGKGIIAKNVDGTWSAMEHILEGSKKTALLNDPWISTTTSLDVARGYESRFGIVAIDLRKVSSIKIVQAKQYQSNSKILNERIAYNRAVWSQEISVYQYIEQGAIIGYVK